MKMLHQKKITHLALEASSHGLAQYRLDGLRFKAAALTQISRDHLDFHETMENYIYSKARLFSDLMEKKGIAVLNQDIPEFEIFQKSAHGHSVWTYGLKGKTLEILSILPFSHSQQVTWRLQGKEYITTVPLIGSFQIHNLACALLLVLATTSVNISDLLKSVEKIKGPPGRLELAGVKKNKAPIFVDYAHSPGGIQSILKSLRPHIKGAIWIVFGGGGGRDPGTRPPMGEAAAQGADYIVITDDNPRYEDPQSIREHIKKGCPHAFEIADREEAIRFSIQKLMPLDALIVAGKGPENGQIVQGKTMPFLDKKVIQKILRQEDSQ